MLVSSEVRDMRGGGCWDPVTVPVSSIVFVVPWQAAISSASLVLRGAGGDKRLARDGQSYSHQSALSVTALLPSDIV